MDVSRVDGRGEDAGVVGGRTQTEVARQEQGWRVGGLALALALLRVRRTGEQQREAEGELAVLANRGLEGRCSSSLPDVNKWARHGCTATMGEKERERDWGGS